VTEPRVADPRPVLPDGLVAVVKRDCPTCVLVAPVLAELGAGGQAVTVYTQDDAGFPAGLDPRHDADLAVSWHWGIDTVPTLLRVVGGDTSMMRLTNSAPWGVSVPRLIRTS